MVVHALDLRAPSNATAHLVMVEQHAVIVSLICSICLKILPLRIILIF